MLEKKSSDVSKSKAGNKVGGLSVVSQGSKPSPTQEKLSKLSAAEELVFLSEFGSDIVQSIGNLVSALQSAEVLTHTSLLW